MTCGNSSRISFLIGIRMAAKCMICGDEAAYAITPLKAWCRKHAIELGYISTCKHRNRTPIDPLEYEYQNPRTGVTFENRIRRWKCDDCGRTLQSVVDADACESRQPVDGHHGTTRYARNGQML